MIIDILAIWFVVKTVLFFLGLGAGILFVLFGDDGVMSTEEYIRRHPEEFKRHSQ